MIRAEIPLNCPALLEMKIIAPPPNPHLFIFMSIFLSRQGEFKNSIKVP
jgi:hypothetical protein